MIIKSNRNKPLLRKKSPSNKLKKNPEKLCPLFNMKI